MYVFRHADGTLSDAPDGFDPENLDAGDLADVDEVLCISRVLVKQLRLVPRPREARAALIREARAAEGAEEKTASGVPAAGRRRGRRSTGPEDS